MLSPCHDIETSWGQQPVIRRHWHCFPTTLGAGRWQQQSLGPATHWPCLQYYSRPLPLPIYDQAGEMVCYCAVPGYMFMCVKTIIDLKAMSLYSGSVTATLLCTFLSCVPLKCLGTLLHHNNNIGCNLEKCQIVQEKVLIQDCMSNTSQTRLESNWLRSL